jgi:kinesin family protein 2/24
MEGSFMISLMIESKSNSLLFAPLVSVFWRLNLNMYCCRKLCMREDGSKQVCIVGLQEYRVADVENIKDLIEKGSATRSTGTTGANEESSRSHAILQLAIKRSVDGNESKPPRLVGKLSFIDLAGSERGADTTDNDKQTRYDLA